jgi:hypothetical protein
MDGDAELTRLVPLALEIGIDPATLRKHVREEVIAATRYGDRWFFTAAQVAAAKAFYARPKQTASNS